MGMRIYDYIHLRYNGQLKAIIANHPGDQLVLECINCHQLDSVNVSSFRSAAFDQLH